MRRHFCLLAALSACMISTTGCAVSLLGPARPDAATVLAKAALPPRLDVPAEVTRPCPLYTLPAKPTASDLEAGYNTRGLQVIHCDAMRDLAVQTHAAEHRLADAQQAIRAKRARPWFLRWLP